MGRAAISLHQTVDLAQIAHIESEIKELTTIRNNMPREAWPHLEEKIADKRAELKAVEEQALQNQREAKRAMIKAILICDYITDVAEQFADASRKMMHSGKAGDTFRQMVKACSDRHEICMAEWGEIVKCIDTKGRNVGETYADWYDELKEELDTVVDGFLDKLQKTKQWRMI